MPFLDRFWWLRIAGGLALIAAALALANKYAAYARASKTASNSPWPSAIFELLLPLLAVALALWVGYRAFSARQRALLLRQALAGNPAVIPLAAFAVDASKALDVAREPLVLMWRPHRAIQCLVWVIILLTLALDAVIIYGARQIMSVKLPLPLDRNSFWLQLALAAGALGLLTLHVAMLLAAPLALRIRTGATFTDEGIRERTRWGWRRFLRWEDARLFEVAAVQSLDRRYTLYGARRSVRWMDEIPAYDSEAVKQRNHENYVPNGVTAEEMSRRLRAALQVVTARTDLAPRTLSPSLQKYGAPTRLPRFRAITLRAAGPLGSALFAALAAPVLFAPAALGVAFISWPPTTSHTLNGLSGLALVAATEVLLVAIALSLSGPGVARKSREMETAQSVTLPEDLLSAPGANYVMPLPGSYLDRRWTVALGLLLLIGGIPGIILICLICAEYISILLFPSRVTSLIASFPHTPGPLTAAALSFCAGVVGLGLAGVALGTGKPWRRQVQVGADGLRIVYGSIMRSLPWDAIETLTLTRAGAALKTYRITGDTGKFNLQWPAHAREHPLSALPKSAILISPGALATLIERQSGVTLTIEELGANKPDHSGQSV
jgi:hypothetical protein